MVKIEFNMENIKKCMCNECPVQENSECAQKVFKMMSEMMKKMEMPDPEKFPGMYCATGKTMCDDLDFDKRCNCMNCSIWNANDLKDATPSAYYCQHGKAE